MSKKIDQKAARKKEKKKKKKEEYEVLTKDSFPAQYFHQSIHGGFSSHNKHPANNYA